MSERKAPYGNPEAPPVALAIRTFRLPLPPTSNHQWRAIVRRGKNGLLHGAMRNAPEYKAWRDEVALTVVRGWQPPERVALDVSILLGIPKRVGRNVDLDGFVKPLLDAIVGKHHDQWIDELHVYREEGEGWAEVTVMLKQPPALSPTLPNGRNGPKSAPGRRLERLS